MPLSPEIHSCAVKHDNAAADIGSMEVPMHIRYDHGMIPLKDGCCYYLFHVNLLIFVSCTQFIYFLLAHGYS